MRKFFTILGLSFLFILAKAQAPQGMNYQAVARNASGLVIANQAVGIRISIIDGTPTGTVQYVETHSSTTNQFGLFNIVIGGGTPTTGTFSGITWSTGSKFIKVEVDPTGGATYVDMGTTKFQSVPYALFAASTSAPTSSITGTTGNIIKFTGTTTGGNSILTENSNKIGLGIANPLSTFHVKANQNNIFAVSGGNTAYNPNDTILQDEGAFLVHSSKIVGVGHQVSLVATGADAGNYPSRMLFYTRPSGQGVDPVERMRLTEAGNLGIGTTTPTSTLEVAGDLKTQTFAMTTGAGANKVLTSDATGNATWQTPSSGSSSTTYTTITPPGCQTISATTTYTKIANLGTFTKLTATSKIELLFQTHLFVGGFAGGASGIYYEIRIDDVATTNGKAGAVVNTINTYMNTSIFGLFTGLSTGTHTVSIWAKTNGGTATNVMYDAGCWSMSTATVKEVN